LASEATFAISAIDLSCADGHRALDNSHLKNWGVDLYLFSGTIADNIRFDRPGGMDKEGGKSAHTDGFIRALSKALGDIGSGKVRPVFR